MFGRVQNWPNFGFFGNNSVNIAPSGILFFLIERSRRAEHDYAVQNCRNLIQVVDIDCSKSENRLFYYGTYSDHFFFIRQLSTSSDRIWPEKHSRGVPGVPNGTPGVPNVTSRRMGATGLIFFFNGQVLASSPRIWCKKLSKFVQSVRNWTLNVRKSTFLIWQLDE